MLLVLLNLINIVKKFNNLDFSTYLVLIKVDSGKYERFYLPFFSNRVVLFFIFGKNFTRFMIFNHGMFLPSWKTIALIFSDGVDILNFVCVCVLRKL